MGKPPGKRVSFFKVMIGDFKTSLKIPASFNKHLRGNLGAKSVLRSRGGRKWHVKVRREERDWSFQSGWEAFVEDHTLVLGDFLVFFYDGDFGFDVRIYGKSGCEKGKEEEDSLAGKNVGTVKPSETSAKKKSKKKRRKKKRLGRAGWKPVYIGRTSRGLIQLTRPLSQVERDAAFRDACSLRPPNPHFVAACRSTRIHHMTIPQALVKEYGLRRKEFISLQDPMGGSWHVKVACQKDGRVNLVAGWTEFLRGNCLGEGDVCVFEFIRGGDVIRVHVFRAKGVKEEIAESAIKSGESVESDKRSLIKTDRERVLDAANSFKTERSCFILSWRLSRLYYVTIPRALVRKFGLMMQERVTLQDPCGRSWTVEIRNWEGSTNLGPGWSSFSRGNHLVDGDACLFEFFEPNVIQVHIFRVEESRTELLLTT